MKKIFNPTISFDGIAMVVTLIGAAIYFGTMKQRLEDHEKRLAVTEQTIKAISENEVRLTTLIEERTRQTLR